MRYIETESTDFSFQVDKVVAIVHHSLNPVVTSIRAAGIFNKSELLEIIEMLTAAYNKM